MNQGRRNRGVRATEKGIEILQRRRHSKGWTKQKLANEADLSLDTVNRLTNRRENVDRDSVESIVYALNLQPTDLIPPHIWDPLGSDPDQLPDRQDFKETGRTRIFISDRGDNFSQNRSLESNFDLAQQLGSKLKTVGQDVFIAGEEMRRPANWFQRFTEELEQCDCYVLLLSPQAAVSEVITEEIRYVWDLYHARNKPTILSIQVGSDVVLHPDICGYLAEFQSREWTSANDTPAIVETILNLLPNSEENNLLIEKDIAPTPPIPPKDPPELERPEYPTGQVRLASAFYIERPPIESNCYQEILHPGALIRVKAPRQMGKTSLMARVLDQAREHGHRTVCLSFQLASSNVLSNLDNLMRWVCVSVSRELGLPNQLAEYWDDIFDGNYNSTTYFENYLLAGTTRPLVIGLDEIDKVFAYPDVANDFLGLLRAWYERARYGDQDSWEKLRFVIVHSTEVYIPMNLNQSPFNVGLSIELSDFTKEQVQDLAQRYQLNWTVLQVEQLMRLVGGHPFLVRIAMYQIAHDDDITLEQVLSQATTESGCYGDHLRGQLWKLGQYPELATAFNQVVNTNAPVSLQSVLAFKLYSMGLVKLEGNLVTPRCELYLRYFRDR